MQKPKVTILCITYNHAPYIRQALEGYLMQETNFPFEIIINDDASTDGTTDIIREYEAKYLDIIKPIYHDENQYSKGPNPAITYWVPNMQGEYVAVSEADDYWTDPHKLQMQVDFLDAHPEYVLCFHNAEVLSDKEEDIHMYDHLEEREYSGIEIYEKWTIPTCSAVFRNVLNYPIETFKRVYFGDIFLFLNLSTKGKFYCINKKMGVYRRTIDGVSFTLNMKKALRLIDQYEFSIEHFAAYPEIVKYSKYCIQVYCWYIMYDCKKATWKQKIQHLVKSKRIGNAPIVSKSTLSYIYALLRGKY